MWGRSRDKGLENEKELRINTETINSLSDRVFELEYLQEIRKKQISDNLKKIEELTKTVTSLARSTKVLTDYLEGEKKNES